MRVRGFSFLLAAVVGLTTPAAAQTATQRDSGAVRPDSAAVRADSAALPADSAAERPDSAAQPGDSTELAPAERDTARGAATSAGAAAPAVAPAETPVDPVQRAICAKTDSTGGAVHILAVVFQPGTQPATRDSTLTAIAAKRLGGTDDGVQYLQVPAGPGFSRRDVEDRMIRLPGVAQVRSVACPTQSGP